MAGASFDFRVGKELVRRLEESSRAILKVEDRVRRSDLETEARYAGTLLVALAAAERGLREAADLAAFAGAADAYIGKLERASAGVQVVHEKVMAGAT